MPKPPALLAETHHCQYAVVRSAFRSLGFDVLPRPAAGDEEGTSGGKTAACWDVRWQDVAVEAALVAGMRPFQRVNHWPGMAALHRKDGLARTIGALRQLMPEHFDFTPRTWILPTQWADLSRHLLLAAGKEALIVKPAASCQGRGIFITRSLADIDQRVPQIVQQCIRRPFLVDGFKFDIRMYVLVASVDPLRLWLHEEGLCRFATAPYAPPSSRNCANVCMHLTNYAINKGSAGFVRGGDASTGAEGGTTGSKRTLAWLRAHLDAAGHDSRRVWGSIAHMIVRTLCAAQPHLRRAYRSSVADEGGGGGCPPRCFEVLGLDVMLDALLRPWLIEVNHSPSLPQYHMLRRRT